MHVTKNISNKKPSKKQEKPAHPSPSLNDEPKKNNKEVYYLPASHKYRFDKAISSSVFKALLPYRPPSFRGRPSEQSHAAF